MPETVDEWMELARSRLSPERTGVTFDEARPAPLPGDIGAVGGFGGVAGDRDVRMNVYIFEDWGAASERIEELNARAEADGRKPMTVVNGNILFFATAGPADRDQFALFDLSSALSGLG